MANIAILPPMQTKKETRPNLSQIIGGTFEDIFETITGNVPPSSEAGEPVETPVPEYVKKAFGPGRIEDFNQVNPKNLIAKQRATVAGFVTQEEVRYEVAGMSEEERNERLHLNTSLRKEFTEDAYHIAELYRQRKAELTKADQTRNAAEIPSPVKQPNSPEVAFEGKSGSTGNISFQAVG